MGRLDELATFLAIPDSDSLAGAAPRLRRSRAITRALAGLEEPLGRRLIERTARRIAPTEAGRRPALPVQRVVPSARHMAPQVRHFPDRAAAALANPVPRANPA